MAVCHDAVTGDEGKPVGEPTEVALLLAASAAGLDPATATARAPRIAELPFDSTRKCMTTVHRLPDSALVSFTKGAAEVVIELSTAERRAGGAVPIDRRALTAIADEMAAEGLRVLAIAMRDLRSPPGPVTPDGLERELEFVGLIGFMDPPRPEARAAIETCRNAGIVPVMITGDHPLTARSVAARLGLLRPGDSVLSGPELAGLSPEELRARVREVRVYARVVPEQKVGIVTALQAAGEVVAMTGDGVNDAPALRQADIGVAMGLAGTDVARAASGIVLLDDNFATVVQAVSEGRRIYDNLRRFVRYVLTTNSSEIWTIFLAPFLGLPVPLLPLQILWINLVTDGLPGLALAVEPAEKDVMRRPPRPPAESLFARGLGAHALLVGILMAALTLAIEAWYLEGDPAAWQTAVFTTLCFVQLAHVLAIRSEETSLLTLGLWSNPALLVTVVLTFLVQLAIVYVPALNELFGTTPLRVAELGVCAGAAALILLVVEAEKWLRRRARAKAG
jgi:Ca2+-transporting ATPase